MSESSITEIKAIYPKGTKSFFFIQALFMCGLSMTSAVLVIYLTKGMHQHLKPSYAVVAAFMSLFFSASLLGGYLGGRYDHKCAIILGGLLASFGAYLVAVPEMHFIYIGLACFIIGGGLFVPNNQCIFGKLFSKDDPLRDSGFTINYIGMNVGSFTISLSSGFIIRHFGFHIAFITGYTLVFGSLLLFLRTFPRLTFHHDPQVRPYHPDVSLQNFLPILIVAAIAITAVSLLLSHASISNTLLIIIGVVMAFVISSLAMKEKGMARKKLFGFLIFIIIGIGFWSLYMLAPSALTIFVQHNVDRHIGSFLIPTTSVYSLNPFFIITLGTMTSFMFLRLSQNGKILPLRVKFAFGIISMGCGYLILLLAVQFPNHAGLIGFSWIILSYFLQTLGELFIGPISFAMVGALVPVRLEGMMMGAMQLYTGVAGAISGFLAAATASAPAHVANPMITNPLFGRFFGLYGAVSVCIGLLVIAFTPFFKKLWA